MNSSKGLLDVSKQQKIYCHHITAHYFDDNCALQEVIIDFGLISKRHYRTNIANGFFKVLEDYNIILKSWSTLEKIIEFLEPFKKLTAIMSLSSNSIAYLIIPLFNIILNHIEDTASDIKTK
ncbi:10610_t:CDS:2, partial [Gigaspora rosea]